MNFTTEQRRGRWWALNDPLAFTRCPPQDRAALAAEKAELDKEFRTPKKENEK